MIGPTVTSDIANKKQLRVGILLEDTRIYGWAWEMLKHIDDSAYASLELVVINDNKPPVKSLWRRLVDNRKQLVYIAYSFLERRITKSQTPSLQPRDCQELIKNVPKIAVQPVSSKITDTFQVDDIAKVAGYELDVIIRLGFGVIRGELLNAARFGIWSLHHGDTRVNRGMLPGFWEVFENWPESGAVLQILSDELHGGALLCRSTSLTLHPFVSRNLEAYNWKAMLFIPRTLKRLHTIGPDHFFANVQQANTHPSFYCGRLYSVPGNFEMASLLGRSALRYVARKIRNIFYIDQWQLFFSANVDGEPATALRKYTPLVPPKDRFWADPHVVDKDDASYVFFEELPFRTGKGHISVLRIDASGIADTPQIVLDRPYHLSYPFVFRDNDKLYMIPETLANETIELYECVSFPNQWRFVMNLMQDVLAVDTTILLNDNRWWLFANVMEHPGVSPLDELFAFHAENFPTTEWTPHTGNPLVSDIASSRPAGPFFTRNGNLYRPSQNSSGRYGKSVNIQHVTSLSPNSYVEHTIGKIKPNWRHDLLGTHTLSVSARLTVIDAEVKRRRFF